MGGRRRYILDGELFTTQAVLKARIQQILWGTVLDAAITPPEQALLAALLQSHPRPAQKIGCGIAQIVVRRNPVYPNQRGFWIVRTDGTETDFSFLECLKPSTMRQKILSACREAVRNDIAAWKHAAFAQAGALFPVVCPLTGARLTAETAHVDHTAPATFERLVADFLTTHGLDWTAPLVAPHPEDGQVLDVFLSQEVRGAWRAYHQTHARLRLLSPQAHLRLPRRAATAAQEEAV